MRNDDSDSDHMIPMDEFDDHEVHQGCKCNPEFVTDSFGAYWRHYRIRPEDAIEYLTDLDNIILN